MTVTTIVPCPAKLSDGTLCEEDRQVLVECCCGEPSSRDYPGTDDTYCVLGYGPCKYTHQLTSVEFATSFHRAIGQVKNDIYEETRTW